MESYGFMYRFISISCRRFIRCAVLIEPGTVVNCATQQATKPAPPNHQFSAVPGLFATTNGSDQTGYSLALRKDK